MKKKQQELISASLSKALEPAAKRRPSPALDGILQRYAPTPESEPVQPAPPTPPTAGTAPTPVTTIAPARDFSRVANSIVRQAVPAGLFTGKSKQLYDFLYARTRAAIVPVRSVRITKEALMRGAHIGSERTLYKNLRRLVTVGLVQVRSLGGEHAGSEYTVLLPEETGQATTPTPPTAPTDTSHKVETLPTAQSGVRGVGLIGDGQETSPEPKTLSFKTAEQNSDDEATRLGERFSAVERELTGKSGSLSKWHELLDLLFAELQIAAARTGQVSSVPAFLTEHLRRRLWKKDKAQLEQENREASSVTESKRAVDASKCPDCGGSGWWYPDGQDRGVAKCRHAQLNNLKS